MLNGIISIYKEAGYTSHDVVAKMRGICRQKKIGHTGTLDPQATGVLPVCLGSGTKLCDMLTEKEKEYKAVMLLGVTTDTQDTTGQVLSEKTVTVTEEQVEQACRSFLGKYQQVPPMYSALKVNGKKLYELAREGKEVERKAREVEILDLQILSVQLPRVEFLVRCTKGTYIRTLCADIGEKLGCGACMESLLRTRVGGFTLEQSVTLAQLEALREEGKLDSVLFPVEKAFEQTAFLTVKEEFTRLLQNGNPLFVQQLLEERREPAGVWVRMYSPEGRFMAVYTYDEQKGRYQPVKMFLEEE